MNGPLYESTQVCEIAGITYRQLDYWMRRGLVTPAKQYGPGSGHRRGYTADEVRHIAVMGRLVRDGFDPEVAAGLASRACHAFAVGARSAHLGLGAGTHVVVDPPELPAAL